MDKIIDIGDEEIFRILLEDEDIVDKWNNRTFKTHKHEIFDYISECIDEMIIETCHNKNKIFDVDDNEHMWYNTFSKWNWTKFDNGVAMIKNN